MVLVWAQGRISTCCVGLECSSSSHILLGKTSHYLSEAPQPPTRAIRSKLVCSPLRCLRFIHTMRSWCPVEWANSFEAKNLYCLLCKMGWLAPSVFRYLIMLTLLFILLLWFPEDPWVLANKDGRGEKKKKKGMPVLAQEKLEGWHNYLLYSFIFLALEVHAMAWSHERGLRAQMFFLTDWLTGERWCWDRSVLFWNTERLSVSLNRASMLLVCFFLIWEFVFFCKVCDNSMPLLLFTIAQMLKSIYNLRFL